MEGRDDSTMARRLMLAACAAGFFWIFALHVLTGFLDFMAKGGVGSRSGMVANIDDAINSALVVPLGGPLAAGMLFAAGIGAAWLVGRTPRRVDDGELRQDKAVRTAAPVPPLPAHPTNDGERNLNVEVWMSSVLSNYDIGMKQGTHAKFYGHDWNPPSLSIPLEPDEIHEAQRRHKEGFALARSDFPEAIAVFDEKRFKKAKDVFTAGPFLAVKGNLAEVLSRFDLGEGGLIPFTIYKADLVTPLVGEFFLLNFGARKNSILPELSRNVVKFAVDHKTGIQHWKVNSWLEDGDVALSPAALDGPDLWFEEVVDNKIFMKNALVEALLEIGVTDVFNLKPCRIVEAE